MNEKNRELLREKIEYYFNNSVKVHVDLFSERFYNGFIKNIYAAFFILNDNKVGNIPIWINEIKIIEPDKTGKEEK